MRFLVDTDVLLDVALERHPHFATSVAVIEAVESAACSAAIAWHTASNLYYIMRKFGTSDSAVEFIYDVSRFIDVAPTDAAHLRVAAKLGLGDFEDAMQVAAAVAFGAEAVVTRNLRHFKHSPIPALSPAQALELIP